ncbi:MAG: hypothetical protein ACREP6_14505 [Candidatus Binataceae bacterium]
MGQRQSARLRIVWALTGCVLAVLLSLVAPLVHTHHFGPFYRPTHSRQEFSRRTVLDQTDAHPERRIQVLGTRFAPVEPVMTFVPAMMTMTIMRAPDAAPPDRQFLRPRRLVHPRRAEPAPLV